jgi:predicted nucleotidyltransferase
MIVRGSRHRFRSGVAETYALGRMILMPHPRRLTHPCGSVRWYCGPEIPISVIRSFARKVAARFQPEKIILFGSYAYGQPHTDSDVDILVVMPARNQLNQAVRISLTIDPPFPLDIIVRTPKNMLWRLQEGDSFLQEIMSKGKVLYEKADGSVDQEDRGRLHRRRKASLSKSRVRQVRADAPGRHHGASART